MANTYKLNSRHHDSNNFKNKRKNVLKKAVQSDKTGLKPDPSLSALGRSIFKAIVSNNKHLNSSDRANVNILSRSYEIYVNANDHLRKDGLIIHGKKSPYYSIVKQSVDTIIKLSSQLNILPKNRINADLEQHVPKKDPIKAALEND